jgi:hypothetical protein
MSFILNIKKDSDYLSFISRPFVRLRVEIVCDFKFSQKENCVKCAILHSGRQKRPLLYKIFVNGFYLSLAVTIFFVLIFENILYKATTVMT